MCIQNPKYQKNKKQKKRIKEPRAFKNLEWIRSNQSEAVDVPRGASDGHLYQRFYKEDHREVLSHVRTVKRFAWSTDRKLHFKFEQWDEHAPIYNHLLLDANYGYPKFKSSTIRTSATDQALLLHRIESSQLYVDFCRELAGFAANASWCFQS